MKPSFFDLRCMMIWLFGLPAREELSAYFPTLLTLCHLSYRVSSDYQPERRLFTLVAGLCQGRAAARIFICSQQKPRTEQVLKLSLSFQFLSQLFNRICIFLFNFSHPVNFCVKGMAVFATRSWPSRTSGRHPYLVPYLEERWNYSWRVLVI